MNKKVRIIVSFSAAAVMLCCVILRLYDEQGKQINFSGIQITAEGVELNKQLNYFHIKSEYGGSITIYAPDLGCKIILNVLVK